MTLPRAFSARWLLALTAGAGAALAHPPFGLLPGLAGYGLLFWLWDEAGGDRPIRAAFARGWMAAFAYFLISCWWVAEAFMVDAKNQAWMAPFAVVLLPAGMGLFWGAAGALYRWIRPRHPALKVLAFAGLLCAAEWLRGHVLTGFPWNLPGETWKAGSAPSQAAALVGAYGLTWVTLAMMAALAAPLALGRSRTTSGLLGLGLAILAGLYGYGWARLHSPRPTDAGAPWVRIVQADVRQEAKYDVANFQSIIDRYVTLTASPAAHPTSIVIWPEGAIPAAANDYLAPGSWTLPLISRSLSPGQTLLVGAYRIAGPADRPIYYNSLLALRRLPAGLAVTGLYDKYRLVPFGEYLPLDKWLTPLGIKDLTHIGDGFSPGPTPAPITPAGVPPFQTLICYESLYPSLIHAGAARTRLRPRWIVNISNDAWFGPTSGPWQHLNLASYRAIEEGLPIVRATPTGVSAVIDAHGQVVPGARLGLGKAGVIDAQLPAALPATLYSRWGDGPLGLAFLFSALSLAAAYRLACRFPS